MSISAVIFPVKRTKLFNQKLEVILRINVYENKQNLHNIIK